MRCRPDRVSPLAESLARRPDAAYVALASGGVEIVCIIRSPVGAGHDDLLLRLPKASSVLDLSIDLLIHPFGSPGMAEWAGFAEALTQGQVRQPVSDRPPATGSRSGGPSEQDAPLLAALAEDGRATRTELAEITGWSLNRVARRMDVLESSEALHYGVDLLPEKLGFHLHATLLLRAPARLRAGDVNGR